MDKKTIDTLRVMLCGEIEDIAKQGNLGTHEKLDILKDLIETEKNLGKIEEQDREKEEAEEKKNLPALMDSGYSQRKYFIDADYQPGMYAQAGGNSYAGGGRAMYDMGGGNSYGRSRVMYDLGNGMSYMDGNSYMYYDPRYSQRMDGGYARAQSEHDMVEELKQMSAETTDPNMKAAISEIMSKLNK